MFKRLFATLALASLGLTTAYAATEFFYKTPSGCEHPFIDILDAYEEEDICFLYNQDVVEGHNTRNYFPRDTITRAEFLKIALLHLGHVVEPKPSYAFNDSLPGDWHYRYVTFARFKGYLKGYEANLAQPDMPITRGEAVVLIARIAEIHDYPITRLTHFDDVEDADWFAYAVALSHELGILEAYSSSKYRPYNKITRGTAAGIVNRTYTYLYDTP